MISEDKLLNEINLIKDGFTKNSKNIFIKRNRIGKGVTIVRRCPSCSLFDEVKLQFSEIPNILEWKCKFCDSDIKIKVKLANVVVQTIAEVK